MSISSNERDEFKKSLKNYTTCGLVVLMQSHDEDAVNKIKNVTCDEVNHARMVFEECQAEFKRRMNMEV